MSLVELTLCDCVGLQWEKVVVLLTFLPHLEGLTMVDMFHAPPKGCSK